MISILGVDPGEHVGVSAWRVNLIGAIECQWSVEMTPVQFVSLFSDPTYRAQYDEVIAENYVPQGGFGNAGPGIYTLKLLGWIEWTWKLGRNEDVQLVTRLDRAASLRRLKHAGWEFHSSSNHAKDAEAVVVAGKKWKISDLILSARA